MGPSCIETVVPKDEIIISHTDLEGNITYVNDVFAKISGYTASELLGKPHAIVRHPDMPRSLFANLWETLQEGNIWSGYVKNLRKDGGYYWVYAQVSALFDKTGYHMGYKSLRSPVDEEKRLELGKSYSRLKEREEGVKKLSLWIPQECYAYLEEQSKATHCSFADIISHHCRPS